MYVYVFMLNHIHLIAFLPNMIGFVRDFKKFTSKEIQKSIIAKEPNLLGLFEDGNGTFGFWEKTNMPKVIRTRKYLLQKIQYVHANPVCKQYVKSPADWVWSSANPESRTVINPMLE